MELDELIEDIQESDDYAESLQEATMGDQEHGLYCKYHITHTDGTELSPGFLFVLRPDRDPAAWDALRAYALATYDVDLGSDLMQWLDENPRPGTLLCQVCRAKATWEFWYIDHQAERQRFCDEHIGDVVNSATKRYEHSRIEEPPEFPPYTDAQGREHAEY